MLPHFPPSPLPLTRERKGRDERSSGNSAPPSCNNTVSTTTPLPQRGSGAGGEGGPQRGSGAGGEGAGEKERWQPLT